MFVPLFMFLRHCKAHFVMKCLCIIDICMYLHYGDLASSSRHTVQTQTHTENALTVRRCKWTHKRFTGWIEVNRAVFYCVYCICWSTLETRSQETLCVPEDKKTAQRRVGAVSCFRCMLLLQPNEHLLGFDKQKMAPGVGTWTHTHKWMILILLIGSRLFIH